jgi:hypothetical protein
MVKGSVTDPDPNPDPDPSDPCVFGLSSSKNSQKNLGFYSFVTSFGLFIFEKGCNVPSKSYKQNNFFLN